jgi:predicted nucleic acid-binding protein
VIVIDTNILVYAADADSAWHARSRDWLEHQRGRPDAWYTTWPILYEFMRVTTHPRVMKQPWSAPHAWEFVSALLGSPGLGVLAQPAILMREHGIRRICTRDANFHRFAFLEVVDLR